MSDDELKDLELKDLKDNVQLQAIIAGQKAKKLTIELNGIQIGIRAAIPRGLRKRMVAAAKLWQGESPDTGDDEIYNIVSELCVDPMYKDPVVWKYIDDETGEVPNVLKMMVEKIMGVEDTAKRFRG